MMLRAALIASSLIVLAGCDAIDIITSRPPVPASSAPASSTPLDALTRLQLPDNVSTVRQAATFVLDSTGYKLVTRCPGCSPDAIEIAAKPISPLALRPQITTIERALILIAGSRTRLVVDDDAHQVSFAYLDGAS